MSYFQPGKTLKKGQYQIIERLGIGGFGVTYLAEDFKRKIKVAIKTINVIALEQRYKDKYGNLDGFDACFKEEQDKFNSEAMILASFDHPHIVKVYPELFKEDNISCMVMEYIKGKNLVQCLQEQGLFTEEAGLKIIKGIGEALAYIHSKNYLHRDVKPQNILLQTPDNQAKLIDFGLAREVDFATSMSLTNAATPPFAPPEQFETRSNFTPALDVYALTTTLFVILAVK
ncbi:serine/threonine-protein kinase [Crocosphaera sp. UHCC 0190]|uniref:serine/threonine protein kinase n=1 Tax=Crocosphaera sp. UHCC 0190 TaxID=3110246 RepID=UPI002B1F0F63|nr:serine/threonine-protein kinase [Crocosphaera sp. UHCC 0190]MEA5512014.1 serine/threonine-protein kinase [Crocosphaera sp. UHCC 0190]